MKSIKLAFAALLVASLASAQVQDNHLLFRVNYSVAAPIGSFKDVISNVSYRGFNAQLLYLITSNWSAGLETGFHDFYQKYPRQLYKTTDGSDVSAVLSNSVQASPLLLKGQYSFSQDKLIRPYLAIGLGGNIIRYTQYVGEFTSDSKDKFSFAAQPEAGVFIRFGKNTRAGFNLAAMYNYMPFNYNGIKNLNNAGATAGIIVPLQ